MKKIRIVFTGTSNISFFFIKKLINLDFNIILILTYPDKPIGRGYNIYYNIVKLKSLKYKISILEPKYLININFLFNLLNFNADLMIIVSYGKKISLIIINLFILGCINLHGSLLPRWQGATPFQRALLAGDNILGISIISINNILDNGYILYKDFYSINKNDTCYHLNNKFKKFGLKGLLYTIKYLLKKYIFNKQNSKFITLAKKLNKYKYIWNLQAYKIERYIRANNPWPLINLNYKNYFLKILKANILINIYYKYKIGSIININNLFLFIVTKKGILMPTIIKPIGKNKMNIKFFLKNFNI